MPCLPAARFARRGAALARRPRPARRRRDRRPRRLLLRRLPARRRDRPLLAGDGGGARVRARRRPGARDLQRLPGALRGGPAAGRAAAQRRPALRLPAGRPRGREPATPRSPARASEGDRLSIPVKHTTGRYYAPEEALDELEADGQVCCATPRARTRTARPATSPACRTRHKQRVGLMPHPEHAVDPLTGSADGGKLFESLVAHAEAPRPHERGHRRRAPPRARPDGRRVRRDRRPPRARAERPRAGGVLADVVRALRLQALEEAAAAGCPPRARTW